ncbi:hypothetical protein D3C71_1754510 [compost metagenome]
MVDRQFLQADVQGAIKNQRNAFGHHASIISVVLPGFKHVAHGTLHHVFADHVFASGAEGLQIAVVATFQQPLAVTYIDGVWCPVDQRLHEFELVAECTLRLLTLLDLPAHMGIPGQQSQ